MLGVTTSPDIRRRQETSLPAVPAAPRAGLKSAPAIESSAGSVVVAGPVNNKTSHAKPDSSSKIPSVSESISIAPNTLAPVTSTAVLTAKATTISPPQSDTHELAVDGLNLSENLSPPTFSLTQGPLTVTGLINSRNTASTSGFNEPVLTPYVSQEPETSSVFDKIFSKAANKPESREEPLIPDTSDRGAAKPDSLPQNIFANESDSGDESEPVSIFKPSRVSEQAFAEQNDNVDNVLEQQVLDELARRDAEVKAHEQAHSAVGGSLAQSPQFSYERGSDGKRYAVDGEVSIDISIVPGDPQATINKMRKVYAAAMAPANPSMADIRVAADAIRKMNQAQSELSEKRQGEVLTIEEMAPMIDAQAIIDGLPPPEPPEMTIGGEVDETGAVRRVQPEEDNVVSDTIDTINGQLKVQADSAFELANSSNEVERYLSNTILDKYLPQEKASHSLNFTV
ncbi:putative metalloprotease CJM1_0395 family protein [uncultured Shewanella sp.]|uniref:putative metalloprotease CJM1_0395 family protein n=1 Tax=uncultured Shewanella sp. TaxID=173975 RepID=UPI0026278270|nr:putative metalloprotease CJM1_0395 family protein [uncultured Shewanella sp.]